MQHCCVVSLTSQDLNFHLPLPSGERTPCPTGHKPEMPALLQWPRAEARTQRVIYFTLEPSFSHSCDFCPLWLTKKASSLLWDAFNFCFLSKTLSLSLLKKIFTVISKENHYGCLLRCEEWETWQSQRQRRWKAWYPSRELRGELEAASGWPAVGTTE